MKIYIGGKARENPRHSMHVCPAADKSFVKGEVPTEWVNDLNEALTFSIDFAFGQAEVPDHLGRYLVDRGLAHKTPMFRPDEARLLRQLPAGVLDPDFLNSLPS